MEAGLLSDFSGLAPDLEPIAGSELGFGNLECLDLECLMHLAAVICPASGFSRVSLVRDTVALSALPLGL